MGYEAGDPYAAFLPPAVETDAEGNAQFHRAVVIVTEHSIKGTERSGQEYLSPLLVLTGQEYARMTFDELHERICDALHGNRAPVVMEAFLPDGTHRDLARKDRPGMLVWNRRIQPLEPVASLLGLSLGPNSRTGSTGCTG